MKIGKWSRLAGTVAISVAVTVLGLKLVGADFSPLAGDASYRQFLSVYGLLTQGYYRPLNSSGLFNGAIKGMVDAVGDPFSIYMSPAMTARFREMVTSKFQGIGAVLSLEGGQMIVGSVIPGSPAQKSGLQQGDALLTVNGKSTVHMSLEQAVEYIRGPQGTSVRLTVQRAGRTMDFTVKRAKLDQATVYARILPDRIGYILITQFSEDTAASFLRDLDILQKNGIRALIIDVRQDPGGLLQSVSRVAQDLLPQGTPYVRIVGRDGSAQVFRGHGPGVRLPMVGLIDGGSASAAEILAAALSEAGHVPLIGEKTYGKGTVQETEEFPDGSSLKLTVARWLTPDGEWIHGKGIRPTIPVPTPSYYRLPPLSMLMRKSLAVDANSTSVAVLQRMLLALGFDPGRTDGYFNQDTASAVSAFQRQHHLPVTGRVDNATAYSLNVAMLALRQRQDPQLTAAVGYLENKLMR